ncbi:serine hydrolase domain-containing protein [Kitasatospora sp. NPDC094015]|uniref:serine hydrolase domain-containing protein n=1 Tax=Kitasatospora sp. NPDC094015 TaxID=3155205 RepID=UPI00332D466C
MATSAVVVGAVVTAAVAADPAAVVAAEPCDELEPDLLRRLRPLFGTVPPSGGITFAVIRGDRRTVACRGYADRAADRPVRADSRFGLGAVTETFTALLLADMVARGEVRYEDPIDRYLPAGLAPGYPHERPITLLHLATHTSGLPRLPGGLAASAAPRWFTDPYATFSAAHLLRALPRTPVRGTPGAQVRYSHLGTGLLGLVLANAAGRRYQDLLTSRICEPLGLIDTSCGTGPEEITSYRRGRSLPSFRIPALPGAAALRSTADDMLRYLQAHLAVDVVPIPERTGAAASLQVALRDVCEPRVVRRRSGTRICLAWNQRQHDGRELHFQAGSTRGCSTFIGFGRAAQVGLVVMANTQPCSRRKFTQLAQQALLGLVGPVDAGEAFAG